ncbi:hypothetical protein HPB48_008751 [Haemaphysalis longicornis]|uniref:Uncharacterized protein n=1 Tax=Haemaphysalis longicornis TaxID=44386 RepID=A0A9J6G7G4_HAELO|nr:hypothetical protein HPB48_008751 [Haemaphysalis longicornis]
MRLSGHATQAHLANSSSVAGQRPCRLRISCQRLPCRLGTLRKSTKRPKASIATKCSTHQLWEGRNPVPHIAFLGLSLLVVCLLCFWAFYAITDMNLASRVLGDKELRSRGSDLDILTAHDDVGIAMRDIFLEEGTLSRNPQMTTLSGRDTTPPYAYAEQENEITSEEAYERAEEKGPTTQEESEDAE